MKHLLLMTTTLFFTIKAGNAALSILDKQKCEDLGYRLTLEECQTAGGAPLFCPFFSAEQKMVACLVNPCIGYPLVESDFSKIVSDGQRVSDHMEGAFEAKVKDAEGTLGCLSEYDKNDKGEVVEKWFYKIKKCKDRSIYQNGICDVGCDREKTYPYSTHPGNLAGNVVSCIDHEGEWFGYKDPCNAGWKFINGRCELDECNIEEYSYVSDPNISENRGSIKTCKVGGNNYYKYISCEDDFTYFNGLCQRRCMVTDCTSEVTDVGYTDYTCRIDPKCRVGDQVISSNNKSIGVIVHMPDETNPRVVLTSTSNYTEMWVEQGYNGTSIPNLPILTNLNDALADYNGLSNTYLVKKHSETVSYSFPEIEKVYKHVSANCSDDFCKQGQWYIPALGEMHYWYNNRFVIKNALNRQSLGSYRSSRPGSGSGIWWLNYQTYHFYPQLQYSSLTCKPFLSFKVKE